jgi:hypothetical protein
MGRRCRALVLLSLFLAGCAPQAPAREYTGPVLHSKALAADFLWEQEITARYGLLAQSFKAVVQSADDELLVVGLTPFNTKAFAIEQRGHAFTFKNFVQRKLPFEAKSILIDIHRTFFVGMTPRPDGVTTTRALGEIRRDRWEKGKLLLRTFEREDEPGKLLTIRYGDGYIPYEPPSRVVLTNDWYGYTLEVETVSKQEL